MFKSRRFKFYSITIILSLVCSMGFILPMPLEAKEIDTSLNDTQAIRKTLPKKDELAQEILNPPAVYRDEADFEFVDQREIINTPTIAPYHSCVSLELVYSNSSSAFVYYGNAFIVSNHTLLTSAHCLYDHEGHGGYVQRVDITFADGTTISSADTNMEVVISQNYVTNNRYEEDLGIIETDIDLSKYGTPLKLASPSKQGQNVSMMGYTSDLSSYASHVEGRALAKSSGWIETLDPSLFVLALYGVAGQSGSPVLADNKAVGIFNFGLRDSSTMEYIRTGGVPFFSNQLYWLCQNANYLNDPIYRAYNPNSGEHLYTRSYQELTHIVQAGWKDEGMAWMESADRNGEIVWRLYNPNTGDHHYTVDRQEYGELPKYGWIQEGEIWIAPQSTTAYAQAVYRLYNPNAKTGIHHFTTDINEKNALVQMGWREEGIAFYAL